MSLTASVVSQINATKTGTVDIGASSYSVSDKQTISYTNGTAANQATHIWTDTRTLAASATENLDLAGVLVDALGSTLTFTAVKAIRVRAADANTNNVVVGNSGANAFVGPFGAAAHTVSVKPGGVFMAADGSAAGWPVVAATGDILTVTNSGAGSSVTYTIEIIGEA